MALIGQNVPRPIGATAGGTIVKGAVVARTTDGSNGEFRVICCPNKETMPFGVALQAAASGDQIDVACSAGDIVYVCADGDFAIGDRLAVTDTDGTVDTHSETAGDNSWSVGQALHAASAAGELVPMQLNMLFVQIED